MVSVITPVSGVTMSSDPVAISHLTAVLRWNGIILQGHLGCRKNGLQGLGWAWEPSQVAWHVALNHPGSLMGSCQS